MGTRTISDTPDVKVELAMEFKCNGEAKAFLEKWSRQPGCLSMQAGIPPIGETARVTVTIDGFYLEGNENPNTHWFMRLLNLLKQSGIAPLQFFKMEDQTGGRLLPE